MKKVHLFITVFCAILFFGCSEKKEDNAKQATIKQNRPNIILVMSDDMGYSDVGSYGSEIETPNLDKLAENGMRFTQFYNAARCVPTRASLLTGLYPHQAGLGWMTGKAIITQLTPYKGGLNNNSVTIAEVLKTIGYSTFMSGKWHMSGNDREDGPKGEWPVQRGFDRFYGTIHGAGSYFDPSTLTRQNTFIPPSTDSLYSLKDYYYTDAISNEAVRFIKERDKNNPFFAYVSYTAPHWPLHAKPEDIEKYKGVYDVGWEEIREKRLERMKELGVVPSDAELSPLDVHSWGEEPDKDLQAGRMEVYAAMIDAMDQGIGQIIDALKEENIFENTLIIYLQDNGGCAEEIGTMGETGPIADNPDALEPLGEEEIQLDPRPEITRDGQIVRNGKYIKGGPGSTYVSYGKVWANASNTPFREYKHWTHEGGIATPLIIHYPNGLKAKNAINNSPGHVIDIMPTLLELTGATYPETFNNNEIFPTEGVSLLPLFYGTEIDREGAIFWEHEMNRAVRLGDWKLVSQGELLDGGYGKWQNYKKGPWELYNMRNDRSEINDLAAQYPEKVKEMAAMWDAYAERTGVFPTPWEQKRE